MGHSVSKKRARKVESSSSARHLTVEGLPTCIRSLRIQVRVQRLGRAVHAGLLLTGHANNLRLKSRPVVQVDADASRFGHFGWGGRLRAAQLCGLNECGSRVGRDDDEQGDLRAVNVSAANDDVRPSYRGIFGIVV